uniref:Transcription factor AP-2 C-terminal domain-containing protein n=1 Tax=Ciona savignyi TaxID=51511 RepID=H2YSM4_CIOSA
PRKVLTFRCLGRSSERRSRETGVSISAIKLSEIGVLLPQGRRKTAQCTLFTSLTESEANQLCNDFGKLCHYNFPSRPLALCAQERHREETENGYDLVVVDKAIQMVDEFIQLMTPSTSHFPSNGVKQEKRVDEAIYTELYNFDTLTHGFGINTINHVMSTFKNYLNCLKEFR